MDDNQSIASRIPEISTDQVIQIWKRADLKPNPINEEIYTDDDVSDLIESIEKNDGKILVPLVITPSGVIISGHRRYRAAEKLGIEILNVIVEDVSEKDMEFRMIQYNIYRRKKYSDILNEIDRLYEYYGRHQGMRTDKLPSQTEGGLNVNGQIAKIVGLSTGRMSELQTIRKRLPEYISKIDKGETSIVKAYLRCRDTEIDKGQTKGVTVPGKIYGTDSIIFNKSCVDMSGELEDNSVQLIVTSPPYYQLRDYKGGKVELGKEETPEDYITNLVLILKDCHRVLKEEGSFFLNLGDTRVDGQLLNIPHRVLAEVMKHDYKLINSIIWNKTNTRPASNFRYLQPSYEVIFHLTKNLNYTYNEDIARPFSLHYLPQIQRVEHDYPPHHREYGTTIPFKKGSIYDFWDYNDILRTSAFNEYLNLLDINEQHPAKMNSLVPILPILLTTKEDDIVLDVFSGSATTGFTALYFARKYRGYEINKEFYKRSVNRMKFFTGEKH